MKGLSAWISDALDAPDDEAFEWGHGRRRGRRDQREALSATFRGRIEYLDAQLAERGGQIEAMPTDALQQAKANGLLTPETVAREFTRRRDAFNLNARPMTVTRTTESKATMVWDAT